MLQYQPLTTSINEIRGDFSSVASGRSIGDVQPLTWDSNDNEIFAMLEEIRVANKQNPLSMSSNMVTYKLAHHL
jgi:hypothetical protein